MAFPPPRSIAIPVSPPDPSVARTHQYRSLTLAGNATCFQPYERFGMRWEEARLPTPEHLRKAYDELLHAIENDRTPYPSPSPQAAAIAVAQNLQSANSTAEHTRPKPRRKGFIPNSIEQAQTPG
ncbi:hypothetical protein NA56DRAFT_707273 [Hyaloscypha hepaticicola]|uniref:Uncharacterized protein n=1 Tax=Hyaloscypha hepaticicola TaxID=2082293 RepID=A0A2J6PV17_9HELO|nr:hypothetical protein NA56DRAFT_707273 [Hyaloscypha hepaticicola]